MTKAHVARLQPSELAPRFNSPEDLVKPILLVGLIALAGLAPVCRASNATVAVQRSFTIYDNMFYRGKPNTARIGLVASNILYENHIWPNSETVGNVPDRRIFDELVRAHIAGPGPLVIDIEQLPLKGSPEIAQRNMQTLATLADWARRAALGKPVGFYGTNTLSRVPPAYLSYARELARHVDAFFPPMYTFDDDRMSWEKRAQASVAEARGLGSGKPVYLYLWPQYHDGTPKQFQYVDAAYWRFQLETARRYADGIVLWSPSRFDWSDASGWWAATEQFAGDLRLR